jgi:hypothetical protein
MIRYCKLSRKERRATNGRYKYEVIKHYSTWIDILPPKYLCVPDYIYLAPSGYMEICKGYRWDGPSFLAIDWPKSHVMEGSLVHDALYQLMREGLLDIKYRHTADEILRDICIECGMWPPRARLWCWFVKRFAGKYAEPKGLNNGKN